MIPWYWLIVAAAVPAILAFRLWLDANNQRHFGDCALKMSEEWKRMYDRSQSKLQRIREFLNEKDHQAISSEEKK